jgi:hypothetical protein
VHVDPRVYGTAGHEEAKVGQAGVGAAPRPGGKPALRQRQELLGVDVTLHVDVILQRHLPARRKVMLKEKMC